MCRKAFCAGIIFCCLSATAHADPTIWLGNWKINNAPGQSIDLNTGLPIAVMIETPGGPPDDQIAGINLGLSVNDLVTGPLIESVVIGDGTVFDSDRTTSIGTILTDPLPERHAYAIQTTAFGTVDAGDGAGGPAPLAFLSFDGTGVTPGVYPIYLTDPMFGPTNVPFFTVTLLDGSVLVPGMEGFGEMDGGVYGMMTVVPEPGSIVLACFAAAWCAAAIARRRKR
jgi:hypothetical protein